MGQKIIARTLSEAIEALAKYDCNIVAGGSDIMLQKRNTAGELPRFEKDVLFIANIEELHKEYVDEEGLHIGATMTLEEILRHELTPNVLKDCLKELASVNIRHFATLPGNIANASPAGDTIVVDILLDAKLKLTSIRGVRYVSAEDFVQGVRKIDLAKDELIEEIIFPKYDFDKLIWFKVGSRKAESISKLAFAAAYKLDGEKIASIRLAFGSVFMKAIRSHELEKELEGMSLKELGSRVEEFTEKYGKVISPIDDQRSTKSYRLEVTKNIVRDFLTTLAKGGN
ncbi:MAG: FAD binding domain-containing protein [Bacilli bacterium]|nr:FAD binding domain-containing protein [Bacilli bacterium]